MLNIRQDFGDKECIHIFLRKLFGLQPLGRRRNRLKFTIKTMLGKVGYEDGK
jgi:hypothetical protein